MFCRLSGLSIDYVLPVVEWRADFIPEAHRRIQEYHRPTESPSYSPCGPLSFTELFHGSLEFSCAGFQKNTAEDLIQLVEHLTGCYQFAQVRLGRGGISDHGHVLSDRVSDEHILPGGRIRSCIKIVPPQQKLWADSGSGSLPSV
jgi:hypothetical protein